MQRINWFPDPNITGTIKPVTGSGNVKIDYTSVNKRNWMRATSTTTGDNYAQYLLSGPQLPLSGSYHMHALVYARGANASFQVFCHANGSYQQSFSIPVGNGQTVIVDKTFTLPPGYDYLLIRIQLDTQTVGAIGMMSDIHIERADTYDTAVGGGGFRASSRETRCRAHRSVRRAGDAR